MSYKNNNCSCKSFVRIPDIELAGKPQYFSLSNHHPSCPECIEISFGKVTHCGTSCVMTIDEAQQMISESDEEYEFEIVNLTQDQFDALPEFAGY